MTTISNLAIVFPFFNKNNETESEKFTKIWTNVISDLKLTSEQCKAGVKKCIRFCKNTPTINEFILYALDIPTKEEAFYLAYSGNVTNNFVSEARNKIQSFDWKTRTEHDLRIRFFEIYKNLINNALYGKSNYLYTREINYDLL